MAETNLSCARGDTAQWTIQATVDGDEIDLTGGRVVMAARRNVASPILFERTSDEDGGITISDQTESPGEAVIKLRADDTLQLSNQDFDLVYSVHVTTADGDQWRVAYGKLSVAAIAWDGLS